MKNVQEVFNKIQQLKKEQREVNAMYKDALKNHNRYEDIKEEIKEKREKKKQIETIVQGELGEAWDKLESIKSEIGALKEMQNDIAMRDLVEGKTVEVKDEKENNYEPVFSVNFRRVY